VTARCEDTIATAAARVARTRKSGTGRAQPIQPLGDSCFLDAIVIREGKNLKGRALGLVLGTVGKSVLQRAFDNTVKAVEARNTR
jgi:hypothetical protein